jgi:hypothetical protein
MHPPCPTRAGIVRARVLRSSGNVSQGARRHVAALVLALVALASVLAPAANADCEDIVWQTRWQPDPFGTSGGSLIRVPVCRDGTPSTKPAKRKAKRREPTRSQLRALRFRPSAAVSATVRGRMIEQLAHGDQAEQIRAHIESGEPMRQFHENLRAHGRSTRDVGDAYAEAYITMWMVANDRARLKRAIADAAARELRRQLALDPKVRRAGDATQQETAEWFGSWTAALAGSMTYLETLDDPARVAEYREKVRTMVMAPDLFDTDLTQIRLTRRGIARR